MEKKEELKKLYNMQKSYILNILWFGVMVLIYFVYISDLSAKYSENKESLTTIIKSYDKITKDGIDFETYKSTITDSTTINLLNKVGGDFYSKSLKNIKYDTYLNFLNAKQKEIVIQKKDPNILSRSQKIDKVLPSYSKGVSVDGNMSDLQFVNYVETLLKSFNITTTSRIGISDLKSTDGEDLKNKDINGTKIYYIPLTLELEGRKSDIIDFLYFVQNVGVISSVSGNNIDFYKDNVLAGKTLIGQYKNSLYNIYENKVVDISSFTSDNYIDSSVSIRGGDKSDLSGFIDFIRSSEQRNESYKVTLGLKFYVKGLSYYTLDSYIKTVVAKFKELSKKNTALLNSAQNNRDKLLKNNLIDVYPSLKSIDTYISENKENYSQLEKSSIKDESITTLYQKANQLNYELLNIEKLIDLNTQKLKNIK